MKNISFYLAFSFLITSLYSNQEKKAEIIFYGGDIVSFDEKSQSPEALAIADGKILFLGSKKNAINLQNDQTKWINLQGSALCPGFIASNSSILLHGLSKFALNVSPKVCKSFSQLKVLLKEKSTVGPVLAMGYDPALISKKGKLNFKFFEEIGSEHPILIINKSATICYANKKAFQLAQITKETLNPEGAFYAKNKKGELVGVAYNLPAISKLLAPFYDLMKIDLDKLLSASIKDYIRKGYTTVIDTSIGLEFPNIHRPITSLYEQLGAKKLGLRVVGYGLSSFRSKFFELKNKKNSFFEIIGLSVNLDGSLHNYQAALQESYKSKKHQGTLFLTEEQIEALIEECEKKELLLSASASGDLAADLFLTSLEEHEKKSQKKFHPYILQNSSLSNPNLLKRMHALDVSPSFAMQDIYLWGDVFKEKILSKQLLKNIGLAKSAQNLSLSFSLNEGGAVSSLKPLLTLQTFLTRETKENKVLNKGEKISIDQALKAVSLHPAKQIGKEKELGSLEEGKIADFTILSKSPRKVPSEKINTLTVLETWVEGKKIEFN